MKTLVIQWRAGLAQGRKLHISQPRVTFGRDAGNFLVLKEPFVSRKHGELRQTNDGWELVNYSPHGTRVNRTLVKDRPHALSVGDIIGVGDVDFFEVSFSESFTDQPPVSGKAPSGPSDTPPEPQSGKTNRNRRMHIWIGLGIWWFLILGGLVFFMTLDQKPSSRLDASELLTQQQIEEILIRPMAPRPPSPVEYRRHIEEGRALASSLQASRTNLYKAYWEFQSALAVAENRRFEDDLDQLTFQSLQKQVVEQTQDRYRQAYARLRAGQFNTAATEFSRLADDLYHLFRLDRQNLLVENVQTLAKEARIQIGKKK